MELMELINHEAEVTESSKIDISWKIRNLYRIDRKKKIYTSQAFFIPEDDNNEWYIKVEYQHYQHLNKLLFSLLFNSKKLEYLSIIASCIIEVLNENKDVLVKLPSVTEEKFEIDNWKTYSTDFFTNLTNNVIMKCKLEWKESTFFPYSELPLLPKLNKYLPPVLADDLSKMMNNCEFNDIIVVANDGTEFRASKFMLAARSPVFKAMFEHETKEKLEAKIKIEDMHADTVKAMLDFIYTDALNKGNYVSQDLLVAADKYNITALKHFCQNKLIEKINIENVASYLLFADHHGFNMLKGKSLDFIKKYAEKVLVTDTMTKLKETQPVLLYDILRKIVLDL